MNFGATETKLRPTARANKRGERGKQKDAGSVLMKASNGRNREEDGDAIVSGSVTTRRPEKGGRRKEEADMAGPLNSERERQGRAGPGAHEKEKEWTKVASNYGGEKRK